MMYKRNRQTDTAIIKQKRKEKQHISNKDTNINQFEPEKSTMSIRLQRPVLPPRCGESPRRTERSWPPSQCTMTSHGIARFYYACRLHKILVNKDLCFTFNAHKISNSKYFSIFLWIFFLFIFTFLLLSSSCWTRFTPNTKVFKQTPSCLSRSFFFFFFKSGTTKAKLKYCKLHKSHYFPLFLSPPSKRS